MAPGCKLLNPDHNGERQTLPDTTVPSNHTPIHEKVLQNPCEWTGIICVILTAFDQVI